jgi:hypothetical protein
MRNNMVEINSLIQRTGSDHAAFVKFSKDTDIGEAIKFVISLPARTLVVFETNDLERWISFIQPKCSFVYQVFSDYERDPLVKNIKESFCFY